MRIGILALQGDVREHKLALSRLGVQPVEVRTSLDLGMVDGLILPGGESTTLRSLLELTGLDMEIKSKAKQGMAIYGTCAGAILLANEIVNEKSVLGLTHVTLERNAYGRQLESFEDILQFKEKFIPAVFIRAPAIERTGKAVEILAEHDGKPVLVRENNILLSTFHPELTDDVAVHAYFVEMVKASMGQSQVQR